MLILPNLASITGITVSPAGTITLTEAQVQTANVDDGPGSALAKMSGETLHVTGVAVADIGTILAFGVAPASITVSGSAADIQADLIAGGDSADPAEPRLDHGHHRESVRHHHTHRSAGADCERG